MSECIGIDLGTTFSAMAYVDEHGDARIIPNDQTELTTPSVVMFEEEPDNLIVGQTAAEQSVVAGDRVVQFVKREMGYSAEEVRKDEDGTAHPYRFWDRTHTPEEISSYILQRLKNDAETDLGRKVEHAVITVPAYFKDPERVATETAGKLAGLNVLTTLDEPTAAALAYGVQQAETDQNVFVFDLGGGTLDVTFMRVENHKIEMLHTDGDHRLGGKDWDDAIIEHIVELFTEAHPDVDPSEDIYAMQELRQRATTMKLQLSQKETSSQPCSAAGQRIVAKISRDEFEEISQNLVDRCRGLAERAMGDLKKLNLGINGWEDIDVILMAGGSTRMPMIQKLVEDLTGKKPEMGLVNPDTCVAIGAAIRAKQLMMDKDDQPAPSKELQKKIGNIEVTSALSHSLGVRVKQGDGADAQLVVSKIIPRSTAVPCEMKDTYALEGAGTAAKVPIMQGEDEDPELCTEIGEVVLRASAEMAAGTPIEVTFSFDEGSKLKVRVREGATGTETEQFIDRPGILSDEQIEEVARHVSSVDVQS